MRRVSVFLITTFLLATLFSCSKENENPTNESLTTWTVDGKSYSVKNIDRNDAGGSFRLVVYADNYIQVNFPATPTVPGSYQYKIVNISNTLASNEISVLLETASTTSHDSYYSTGTDNISATVTVGTDGKLKVVIPTFEVEHLNSISGIVGNTTALANIIE